MDVDDTLKDFLVECFENLDHLDRDFVALESDPTQLDRLAAIFRTVHTIKGNSGFLGFGKLEALAHAGESLLSGLRDGAFALTPTHTSLLLSMVDRIRAALKTIEELGREGAEPHDDIIRRFAEVRAEVGGAQPAQPSATDVASTSGSAEEPSVEPMEEAVPSPSSGPRDVRLVQEASAAPVQGVAGGAPMSEARPEPAPRAAAAERPREAVVTAQPERAMPQVDLADGGTGSLADTNVRVDVSLLDKLMNLVGELVLSRNQIMQFGARIEEAAGAAQRLNLITTELQEQVMKTRMQPIGNVWSKLPRVVRDLSITCGKQVRVAMVGKETELDRTILEAIKDPLTHVVRNAVDHGIETSEVRLAQGKSRTGTLTLRAYHEGGQVNIEISDDGAGINAAAVRKKAIERNVVSAERAASMSEKELIQLVFLPGFSTAEKISNVSGRGVGMDVVKTNIERIGGTVDLRATAGRGTTLHIKIPLTLAIVPALVVDCGPQRYAIPQASLLELVRLEGHQAHNAIERIHGTPVYRLRGKLLPIVFLEEQLEGRKRARQENAPVYIVVLQADGRQFGLVVDEVRDTEEIVVKSLGKELKGISLFAGATIMGDGRVALILDVLGLAQHARVISSTREGAANKQAAERASTGASAGEAQTLLLFDAGDGREMAVPLAVVARLEEFPARLVERVGRRRVVQYRGQILPLIDLAEALGHRSTPTDGPMQVIVYTEGSISVGFIVSRILDVVEELVRIEAGGGQKGVLGAAIVNGKVVEFLDVIGLVRSCEPSSVIGRAA